MSVSDDEVAKKWKILIKNADECAFECTVFTRLATDMLHDGGTAAECNYTLNDLTDPQERAEFAFSRVMCWLETNGDLTAVCARPFMGEAILTVGRLARDDIPPEWGQRTDENA